MIDGNADHQRLQIVSVVTSIAYYRSNTLFKKAHLGDNKITYVMPLCRMLEIQSLDNGLRFED
jgi:hypothetical protein